MVSYSVVERLGVAAVRAGAFQNHALARLIAGRASVGCVEIDNLFGNILQPIVERFFFIERLDK